MSSILAYWYRATCFGAPIGPWRNSLRAAKGDLEREGLGSYDEWGQFYITVPGGLQQQGAWMDFAEWAANGRRAA